MVIFKVSYKAINPLLTEEEEPIMVVEAPLMMVLVIKTRYLLIKLILKKHQ